MGLTGPVPDTFLRTRACAASAGAPSAAGQTLFHGVRMWGQLLQAGMMLAALIVVAVPAWNLWRTTTGADWYAAGMLTLAEVKLVIGYQPDSGQVVRDPDGTRRVLTIRTIAASVPAARIRERIRDEVIPERVARRQGGRRRDRASFSRGSGTGGVQLGRRHRVRGAELVTAAQLRRRIQPLHRRLLEGLPGRERDRAWRLAGIPFPPRSETQHTIVSGTTGSGKTVLISDLVAQVREKRRALRDLRQDGLVHTRLLRSRRATCC